MTGTSPRRKSTSTTVSYSFSTTTTTTATTTTAAAAAAVVRISSVGPTSAHLSSSIRPTAASRSLHQVCILRMLQRQH